jgi:GGDEF domain-containing protein
MARAKKTKVHTSLSIGVANFPTDAAGKEELIAKVEEALQLAKSKGGNNTSYPSS